MVRKLYRNLWLLGAQKDTLPRRKWFRLVSSSLAASLFAANTKGQSSAPFAAPFQLILVDAEGASENWEGSHPEQIGREQGQVLATMRQEGRSSIKTGWGQPNMPTMATVCWCSK